MPQEEVLVVHFWISNYFLLFRINWRTIECISFLHACGYFGNGVFINLVDPAANVYKNEVNKINNKKKKSEILFLHFTFEWNWIRIQQSVSESNSYGDGRDEWSLITLLHHQTLFLSPSFLKRITVKWGDEKERKAENILREFEQDRLETTHRSGVCDRYYMKHD